MRDYLIVVLVAILSIFISGYNFDISDQQIFIPFIQKLEDPSLFAGDQLFNQFTANASLFYQLAARAIHYLNIETVFLIGFLITRSAYFIGIFLLSKTLFNNNKIAILSLLPFVLPKFIGGTAIYTNDNFFGYRMIGTVFLLYYLWLALKGKFTISTVVAGISFFFHPLTLIPNMLFVPALIVKNSSSKIKDLTFFGTFIFICLILYKQIFKIQIDLSSSPNWIKIIESRDSYLFLKDWTLFGWLAIFLYGSLIFLTLKYTSIKMKKEIILLVFSSLFTMAVGFILLEVLKIPSTAKFQLLRSFAPVSIIALIVSPRMLLFKNKITQFLGVSSFMFLCLNFFYPYCVSFLILLVAVKVNKLSSINFPKNYLAKTVTTFSLLALVANALYLKSYVDYPINKNDWINLQLWTLKNTSLDSMFLVPPDQTGFRIFSKRSIVGDVKDGAVVIYSPQYAEYWSKLMKDLQNYDQLNKEQINNLSRTYQFNYLVTKKNQKLDFEKVYENYSYNLYKI